MQGLIRVGRDWVVCEAVSRNKKETQQTLPLPHESGEELLHTLYRIRTLSACCILLELVVLKICQGLDHESRT